MAVALRSFLVPASASIPFLMEDRYLKGGMRCLANVAARDAVLRGARTSGMLVWCIAEKAMYQLAPDLNTWEPAQMGGGGEQYIFDAPFTEARDAQGNVIIGINSSNRIPRSPGSGYILQSGPNQTLMWVDGRGNADRGTRQQASYEAADYIAPGDSIDFNLEMSRTSLMIEVELNAVDIEIQCHTTQARDDANPYIFRSSANLLKDDGTSIQDGELVKLRRFSFAVNMDNTVFQYWTMKNIGDAPAKPKLSVTFLVLQ